MNFHSNKIFILGIISVVIISAFLYKAYSVDLQEEKEKEVINAQLLKEKEIISEKGKMDENARREDQTGRENQKELLNSCLKIGLEYFEKAQKQVLVPYYNQCVEIGNRYPSLGSECLNDLSKKRSEVRNDLEKSEADCYKRYPQK